MGMWKQKRIVAEIPKNKSDIIRITELEHEGMDYIQMQVFRKDKATEALYPLKNTQITWNPLISEQIANAIMETTVD